MATTIRLHANCAYNYIAPQKCAFQRVIMIWIYRARENYITFTWISRSDWSITEHAHYLCRFEFRSKMADWQSSDRVSGLFSQRKKEHSYVSNSVADTIPKLPRTKVATRWEHRRASERYSKLFIAAGVENNGRRERGARRKKLVVPEWARKKLGLQKSHLESNIFQCRAIVFNF